jgi:hypothetical protein
VAVVLHRRAVLTEMQFTDRALMREVGLLTIRMIQARTRQGRDTDGRAFPRYSATYAKQKAKALGSAGTVDLTVSGDMLNALTIIDLDDASVTIGWTR